MVTKIYNIDPTKTYRVSPGKCYACDQKVIGATLHNGQVKGSCKRHTDPHMKVEVKAPRCCFCDDPVRSGQGQCVDDRHGTYAHLKCIKEQCET